jgi:hydrogenase/urease accessory protein HupE
VKSSKVRLLSVVSLVAVLVCLTRPAAAHPVPFSYLDLRLGEGKLEGALTAHLIDLSHDLHITPPESLLDPAVVEQQRAEILEIIKRGLQITADGTSLEIQIESIETRADQLALTFRLRFNPQSYPGILGVHCTLFSYEAEHQTFLNVYESGALVDQEIFSVERTGFEYYSGGRLLVWGIVRKFVPAGIHHIFAGPDHILFIIGLLLLGGTLTRLLTIVTGFTIAHSITLSLAALDILNPPSRLIEASIALSIVYVGIDNLMVGEKSRDFRALIAFFFGFVHGFGFASVLREFGLPSQALGWALFSFNVGVEIGQICIVIVAASLLAALRKRWPVLGRRIVVAGSVVVIAAGTFWFFQRVFA